jgi:hypothetical protein
MSKSKQTGRKKLPAGEKKQPITVFIPAKVIDANGGTTAVKELVQTILTSNSISKQTKK